MLLRSQYRILCCFSPAYIHRCSAAFHEKQCILEGGGGAGAGGSMSNLPAKKPRKLGTMSTAMDLPATPNPNLRGDQLLHFSHPQHPLLQISLPYLFTCMGCKEYGAGMRFRCQTCGFDLHDFCALAPPALHNHPFHHKHQLVFFTKPGRPPCTTLFRFT